MKKRFLNFRCRKPKTHQERKASLDNPELIRAKRRKVNLPTSWDDLHIRHSRSWKKLRNKQYNSPRGKKHTIWVQSKYYSIFSISQELMNQSIPNNIDIKCINKKVYYFITWWSDKDIGIDYILKLSERYYKFY